MDRRENADKRKGTKVALQHNINNNNPLLRYRSPHTRQAMASQVAHLRNVLADSISPTFMQLDSICAPPIQFSLVSCSILHRHCHAVLLVGGLSPSSIHPARCMNYIPLQTAPSRGSTWPLSP